jgi:hypothetical protein
MDDKRTNARSWLLVGAWFSTIIFVGVLKRILDQQQHESK